MNILSRSTFELSQSIDRLFATKSFLQNGLQS